MQQQRPPTSKAEYLSQPMINPMMQEAMQQLNEQNYFFFLMQNSEFVQPEDQKQISKIGMQAFKNFTFASILGIFINVQFKRVPAINFLNWNKYLRWTFRLPLFFLPFGLFVPSTMNIFESLFQYHCKYYRRIQLFQKTGDMRALDPEGLLFENFQKQQGLL